MRAPRILYVLKEGTPDVLKRPKNLLSRSKKSVQVCTFVCNANPYPHLAPYPRPYMAHKKKPPPLHVSVHRIQLECNNVALRTEVENVARHGCLNAISICFCLLLLLFCLLFYSGLTIRMSMKLRYMLNKNKPKNICIYHHLV